MKFLRIMAIGLAGFLVLGLVGLGIARLVLSGPIGPMAGGALDGNPLPAPYDWSFTDDHGTIAVEVDPEDPHSVSVVCFVLNDELYIPAMDGADKKWTHKALVDGRARVQVGEDLYLVQLIRIEEEQLREAAFQAAMDKYPQLAERASKTGPSLPDGAWLFRAERRE